MQGLFVYLVLALAQWPHGALGACEFPESMRGEWFQKAYHENVVITKDRFSKHGQCRERKNDKFLLFNERDRTFSFVVITQKHPNVMQYKETPAPLRGNWTLDQAYTELTGDTPLYSVFRINGEPVPCPFRDTFLFSYNRGSGNCSSPPSVSDFCTDKSRVLFNFKACYDTNSESRKETLTCIGTWKEGSHHFLVGKMEHTAAHSNEDRFRCFIYEESRRPSGQVDGYNVAISGDATCDGVQSPNEGSTTLHLSRDPRETESFPSWMYKKSHHWRTLNRSRSFEISRQNSSLVIQADTWIEQRWTCDKVYDLGENHAKVVVHTIQQCESGYICVNVFRRAANVLELQMGQRTLRAEDACLQSFFDPSDLDYVTLLADPPGVVDVPLEGKFLLVRTSGTSGTLFAGMLKSGNEPLECSDSDMTLLGGCQNKSSLKLTGLCADPNTPEAKTDTSKAMYAQATWELEDEHGTTKYLAVSHKDAKQPEHRYCLAITEDQKYVFYLGSASCSRRQMQLSNRFDLRFETKCPASNSPPLTTFGGTIIVIFCSVLILRSL